MVQRFGSMRALSFRLLAGHALLVLGTSALAQAPAKPQLPPPVSSVVVSHFWIHVFRQP